MAVPRSSFAFSVFSLLVVFGQCASFLNTPCHQIISSHELQKIDTVTLKLNTDCKNGIVDWHMPRSNLRLNYDKNQGPKFKFCMVKLNVTNHIGLTDLTDDRNIDIPMPTDAKPSCINSDQNGNVIVLVKATSDVLNFMTSMKYSVSTLDHPLV